METFITVKEIAARRRINPDYLGNMTRMKGFPDPKRIVGTIKLFDVLEVDAYFATRETRRKTNKATCRKRPGR